MTLDQGDYCRGQGLDAQDPPCGRVILTGSSVSLEKGSVEYEFAKESMFSKHPGTRAARKCETEIWYRYREPGTRIKLGGFRTFQMRPFQPQTFQIHG